MDIPLRVRILYGAFCSLRLEAPILLANAALSSRGDYDKACKSLRGRYDELKELITLTCKRDGREVSALDDLDESFDEFLESYSASLPGNE